MTMRTGETARDRANGKFARNAANKAMREEWMRSGGEFPSDTCNGKKNRLNRRRKVK